MMTAKSWRGTAGRAVTVVALALAALLPFVPARADDAAIVNAPDNKLNLRDGPNANSNIITVLSNNTKVHIVASLSNGWQKIVVDILADTGKAPADQLSGFANGKYLITVSAMATPAFRDGHADRQAWEAWFGALSGAPHAGADFWASHRSDSSPPDCTATTSDHAFQSGCEAAKKRLDKSDQRRRTEANYKTGWNSPLDVNIGATSSAAPDSPPGPALLAEAPPKEANTPHQSNDTSATGDSVTLSCQIDREQSRGDFHLKTVGFGLDFRNSKIIRVINQDGKPKIANIPFISETALIKWEFTGSTKTKVTWILNSSKLILTVGSSEIGRLATYQCRSSARLPTASHIVTPNVKALVCTERGDTRYSAKLILDLSLDIIVSQQSGVIDHGTNMPFRIDDNKISWTDGGLTYILDRTTLEINALMGGKIPLVAWDCQLARQQL